MLAIVKAIDGTIAITAVGGSSNNTVLSGSTTSDTTLRFTVTPDPRASRGRDSDACLILQNGEYSDWEKASSVPGANNDALRVFTFTPDDTGLCTITVTADCFSKTDVVYSSASFRWTFCNTNDCASDDNSGINSGVIVGCVVGGVLLLILIVWYCTKITKQSTSRLFEFGNTFKF